MKLRILGVIGLVLMAVVTSACDSIPTKLPSFDMSKLIPSASRSHTYEIDPAKCEASAFVPFVDSTQFFDQATEGDASHWRKGVVYQSTLENGQITNCAAKFNDQGGEECACTTKPAQPQLEQKPKNPEGEVLDPTRK